MTPKRRRLNAEHFPSLAPTPRRAGFRPPRRYYLIVCEGEETEPNYFEALRETLPNQMVERITVKGSGRGTSELLKCAKKEVERRLASGNPPYYYVWLVFDKDEFPDFDRTILEIEALDATADPQKRRPHWFAAWSNEAFELWYLLHFQDITGGPLSRKGYQALLSKALGFPYQKNDPNLYPHLANRVDLAIARAQRLLGRYPKETPFSERNPCTTVGQLVDALLCYQEHA